VTGNYQKRVFSLPPSPNIRLTRVVVTLLRTKEKEEQEERQKEQEEEEVNAVHGDGDLAQWTERRVRCAAGFCLSVCLSVSVLYKGRTRLMFN